MAPAALVGQWQNELREKFNLNWPIYDGHTLTWYPCPALRQADLVERKVARDEWHKESCVIASSHLMRRTDRARELLEADPWDLVILDEAHHARRRGAGAGAGKDSGPNKLLRLMQELRSHTQGLVLLTATPMQVRGAPPISLTPPAPSCINWRTIPRTCVFTKAMRMPPLNRRSAIVSVKCSSRWRRARARPSPWSTRFIGS